jgi:predicted dehydrogenase
MIGEINEVSSMVTTSFFPMEPLEDNGMAILKTQDNVICSLHASLTQWKNLFSFEITGSDGYIIVEGLGDSYGTQKLLLGYRDHVAPFSEKVTEYRGLDRSWYNEWKSFKESIVSSTDPSGNIEDAIQAMKVVFACYKSSKTRKNELVSNFQNEN